MSEPFIVAAHVPMSEAAFRAWLAAPVAPPDAVTDWRAMFTGWCWDGRPRADPGPGRATPATNLDLLAARVAAVPRGEPFVEIARYLPDPGALAVYHLAVVGEAEAAACRLIAALRGAAAFADADAPGYVIYWPEPSGYLRWPAVLACAELADGASRFVPGAALGAAARAGVEDAVHALAGLYHAFLAESLSDDSSWPDIEHWSDPRFCDPAIREAAEALLRG